MCGIDPVSMFVIGTVATTALSSVGSIMQGNAAEQGGRAQQVAYDQAAERERVAAGYEGVRTFEKGRRAQSAAIVQTAGSGLLLTGSPSDVLADNATQNQLDIDAIRFGSKIKQQNLQTQGDLALFSGQQRQQAGYIGAATTAASGLTSLYTPRNAVRMGGSAFA